MHIKVELVPFTVPDEVYMKQKPGSKADGIRLPASPILLKDLDVETLRGLCDEFAAGVFKKAGIQFQNPRFVETVEQDNMENITQHFFGMSRTEAQDKGICISCKEIAESKIHTNAGKREYCLSSLCEECFDEIFQE